jgi:hypothetical protein
LLYKAIGLSPWQVHDGDHHDCEILLLHSYIFL